MCGKRRVVSRDGRRGAFEIIVDGWIVSMCEEGMEAHAIFFENGFYALEPIHWGV